MQKDEPVYIGYGEVLGATDKALLICLDNLYEIWVPYSILGIDCALEDKGDVGDVIIPFWLADREGLPFDPV